MAAETARHVAREAAVLVERYVESLRVGRAGANGHVARLRLASDARGGAETEVHVHVEEGRVRATIHAEDVLTGDSLARRIRAELASRGLDDADVELAP